MICRQPDLVRRNRDAAMNDETGWRERPGILSSIVTDKPRWNVALYLQTLGRCSPILTKGDSSPSMTTERSAVGPTSPKKVVRRWDGERVEYQPIGRISTSNAQ